MYLNLRVFLMFLLLALSSEEVLSENAELLALVGEWGGEGHFYNVKLKNNTGPINFQLSINSDLEVKGKVGDAHLINGEASIDHWNKGLKIRGLINGKIFPDNDFHRKKIILLIQTPQKNDITGDFHLKNNYVFDIRMRPGGFELKRIP